MKGRILSLVGEFFWPSSTATSLSWRLRYAGASYRVAWPGGGSASCHRLNGANGEGSADLAEFRSRDDSIVAHDFDGIAGFETAIRAHVNAHNGAGYIGSLRVDLAESVREGTGHSRPRQWRSGGLPQSAGDDLRGTD